MKKRQIITGVIVILLICIFGFYKKINNDVIAKTNSYTVSEKEIGKYIRFSKLKYEGIFAPGEWNEISNTNKKKDQLIKNTIENIVLSNKHEEEIEKLKIKPKNLEKVNFNLEDKESKKILKENNLTPEFIKKATIFERIDDVYESYKKSKIKINEEEMKEYYEQHKKEFTKLYGDVYQIWIKKDSNGKTTKEIAESAYQELKEGKKFEDVVQKYSQDKGRSYIGYVNEEELLKPVKDVFIKIKDGETSEPIETGHGYFIIKVYKKKNITEDYSKVKENIKNKLIDEKYYEGEEQILDSENVKFYKYKYKRLYPSF